jgi:hypothetical protein
MFFPYESDSWRQCKAGIAKICRICPTKFLTGWGTTLRAKQHKWGMQGDHMQIPPTEPQLGRGLPIYQAETDAMR